MNRSSGPAPDAPRDYEIILVAYRSRPLIESLLGMLPADLPVVVVDNAQGADGLPAVAAARPATRYLDGPGRGFATGANLGARTSNAPYVIFVNPDSSPTLEQLDSLVDDLRKDPRLAAVGPITTLPDGRVEIGVGGWEPNAPRAFAHAVGMHKIFPSSGLWARPAQFRPIDLDWLSGACLAVPRQTFLDLGGFDESYFVYSEDVEFGRQVRKAGLGLRLRTDMIVPHLSGGSGSGRPWMAQHRSAALVQYVRRYRGLPTVTGVRLALTLGLAARSLVCRLRRNDGLAREHAAYVKGLWAGPPDVRDDAVTSS